VARWVSVQPTVQTRLNREIAAVDLRYQNGFAMRAPGALDKAPAGAARAAGAPAKPAAPTPRTAPAQGPSSSSKRSQ